MSTNFSSMSDKKKIPGAILALIPSLFKGVVSLIQDKKKKKRGGSEKSVAADLLGTALDTGIQLSSKRVMNLLGTGVIVAFAIADMTKQGINAMNLSVLGIGAAYALGMAFITHLSEKE